MRNDTFCKLCIHIDLHSHSLMQKLSFSLLFQERSLILSVEQWRFIEIFILIVILIIMLNLRKRGSLIIIESCHCIGRKYPRSSYLHSKWIRAKSSKIMSLSTLKCLRTHQVILRLVKIISCRKQIHLVRSYCNVRKEVLINSSSSTSTFH